MPEQQSYFEGLAPAPVLPPARPPKGEPARRDFSEGKEILFIALFPEPSLFPALENQTEWARQEHGLTGFPIGAERRHISVLSLGDFSDRKAKAFAHIASSVRFPAIEITLDTAMTFFHRGNDRHPFVLSSENGAHQVGDFHRMLGPVFLVPFKSHINPHMTLVWDRKVIPTYTIDKPISWTAHEFALVKSYQGKSRYEIVGRWPLLED